MSNKKWWAIAPCHYPLGFTVLSARATIVAVEGNAFIFNLTSAKVTAITLAFLHAIRGYTYRYFSPVQGFAVHAEINFIAT